MKYVPRPPTISFEKVMKIHSDNLKSLYQNQGRQPELQRNRHDPEQSHHPDNCDPGQKGSEEPAKAHWKPEKLEANVFARILAARAKRDAFTGLILPSTLMNRVGITRSEADTEKFTITAVDPTNFRLRGPRVWISPYSPDELPQRIAFYLCRNRSEFRNVPVSPNFGQNAHSLLLRSIESAVSGYEALQDRHQICEVSKEFSGVQRCSSKIVLGCKNIPVASLPSSIVHTPTGMRLAGMLYKHIIFYDSDAASEDA